LCGATVGLYYSAENIEAGGFAGSIWAQQANNVVLLYIERKAIEGGGFRS